MRVKILNRYWRIVFEPLFRYRSVDGHAVDGLCDPPTAKNRTIHIERTLTGQTRLETILHEFLHAADSTRREEWVTQAAADCAEMLWKLGYRQKDDADARQ